MVETSSWHILPNKLRLELLSLSLPLFHKRVKTIPSDYGLMLLGPEASGEFLSEWRHKNLHYEYTLF